MRILVTRPEVEGRGMARRLIDMGHDPIPSPLLEIVVEPPSVLPLDGVQAILVTSRHGAEALASRREAHRLPLLAVGRVTAAVARRIGFETVLSGDGDRQALVRLAADRLDPADGLLLWAAGRERTPELAFDLGRMGFRVEVIEVYRAEAARELTHEARAALTEEAIDAAAVHSPRSAEILLRLLEHAGFAERAREIELHAVSEAVAAPFRRAGWKRIVVAPTPDQAALMETFETDPEP
jgi:uroporphyrinogen-III synthase